MVLRRARSFAPAAPKRLGDLPSRGRRLRRRRRVRVRAGDPATRFLPQMGRRPGRRPQRVRRVLPLKPTMELAAGAVKPRVLVVTPWPPLPLDAGSRRVWTACRRLRDRYDFSLLTFHTAPPAGEDAARLAAQRMAEEAGYFRGIFRKVH